VDGEDVQLGVGSASVATSMVTDSRPVDYVGYPAASIIFSWSMMRE
jgi:hypothetical protein